MFLKCLNLELENAQKYYEKSLGIIENLVQMYPENDIYRENLICTLKDVEAFAVRQKQYESAIKHRERITELSFQIASENPKDRDYKKELALSHEELGMLFEKVGKPELAKQQYSKSANVYRNILQDKNEEDIVKDLLAMGFQRQATVFMHDKKYGLAKEYLALVRDYYEDLYEKAPEKPENWKRVCEIRILNGILHENLGNYDVAIPIYESVFPILNKHLESDPDNLEYQSIMSVLETQLGITYHSTGEYEKSKKAFEKSILLNTQILEEDPENFLNLGAAAITFTEYSKLLTDMGKEEAEEYAAKADKIKEKLDKMCGPDGVMLEDQEPGKEV